MSNNPTAKKSWQKLKALADSIKIKHLNDLFTEDPNRVKKFTRSFEGLHLDFSKQLITSDVFETTLDLIQESHLSSRRDEMFSGCIINSTEKRAVLHTALRRPHSDKVSVEGKNIMPEIQAALVKMKEFSKRIRNGEYKGVTGKSIDTIVSLGIGGSDLGPRLIDQALDHYADKPKLYFVANIDGDDLTNVLHRCDPEKTLFIVISKSFSTQETLTNAKTAQIWLQQNITSHNDFQNHFAVVSANNEAAKKFGANPENFFPFWEWVNGRFSLWSAVSIQICIRHGFDAFQQLLDGAYAMDQHFKNASPAENIPIIMALMGIWNTNFLGADHHAVLPYSKRLSQLPFYLQQLEMESNGKSIDINGHHITDYKTGPVLFGEAGTIGQHSFYQLLHQGTSIIPCDFIGAIKPNHILEHHHDLLLGHMLAQAQSMMQGQQKPPPNEPYRYFAGNKPSNTILLDRLDAYHLGMLIALYEHKTFTQGVIWNINSFDQYGVELGKAMAKKIEQNDLSAADPSTKALHSFIHNAKK